MENTINSDSGAQIRDGIKSLAGTGVCNETLWPYDVTKFAKTPPSACYADAHKHKILKYYKILSLEGMKQCLAMGYPFVFGFAVFESFETIGSDGIMPIPDVENEEFLGGHAVLGAGYNLETQYVKVRNSWGKEWGEDGNFYMPFSYIANKMFCSDFWCISKEM